eukprot:gnl/TRDRNA2_/TRDRNA2_183037_c0_seq1.p2 gnl/TRDRNA2_/TRDRNA2_183037_c0~~gnl/TRDRNA2_/TRDRNA2_183037_c0_seq1.p2  ORF type:complete len:416 (+),score=95.11 gnl/TRDRNA2_/TRDRNA2_183037_c0_seq1:99-1250(+)
MEDETSEVVITTDENGVRWGEDEYGKYRIDDKVWTMNEIRDHPLFMEDVPSDISDNPHLVALQNLVYGDEDDPKSPEELALHFKKLGNEAFSMKDKTTIANQNAMMCYTKALEQECKDAALNSQLHSNRAAVSLRIGEYSKAVDDCRRALEFDRTNVKAFFRGAKASEALGLTAQALRFATNAVSIQPDDKEMKALKETLEKRLAKENKGRAEDVKKQSKAREDLQYCDMAVVNALGARDVKIGPPLYEMTMYLLKEGSRPKLGEDCDTVSWPLLLLYDETNQSDFVESFEELCCMDDQLQMMFPEDRHPGWDEEGKYVWDRLSCYMECFEEGGSGTTMVRIRRDVPLQGQLSGHCIPPVLVFHVLVTGTAADDHFCKSNDLT